MPPLSGQITESLTVDAFMRRHGLNEADLLVLAHDHPTLLPEIIDAGEGIRVLDLCGSSPGFYSPLPVLSRELGAVEGAESFLTAEKFCARYKIGPEGLLRLILTGNLPEACGHNGRLVFRTEDVRRWERLNGLRLLQRLQAGQSGSVAP